MSRKRKNGKKKQSRIEHQISFQKETKNVQTKAKKEAVKPLSPEEELEEKLAQEAARPFPLEQNLKEKIKEWNLPKMDKPGKEGNILYYAEAQNDNGCPQIIIRALVGDEIPEKGFHKARQRGFVVWRPTFIKEEWGGVIKNGKNGYEKFTAPASGYKVALEKLISLLSSLH